MMDTLRADRLGVYGHAAGNSPNLDEIAASGVTFERTISAAPWTQPSIASLFCSMYPAVHKVVDYGKAFNSTHRGQEKVAVFADSFDTLAEELKRNGYATSAFVANPFILQEYGFAQGFDHFDTKFVNNNTPGSMINDAALAWIDQPDREKPFFLYLHYMDAHGPYYAGPEFIDPLLDRIETMPARTPLSSEALDNLRYLRKLPPGCPDPERHKRLFNTQEYWSARYEAGVRQQDHHIGKLREALQERDLWEESFVIITADHGEALNEHGFWEHGWSCHHTDLHVPLILHWPEVLPAGRRIDDTVRLIDLMPTILDELGVDPGEPTQGRSLVGLIEGGSGNPTVAYAEAVKLGEEQKAVHLGKWKLLVTASTGQRELYNLETDPLEQNNLIGQPGAPESALVDILARQLEVNKKMAAGSKADFAPLSPEQLERLRSIGYVE
jgi:arylsulfatase A-like enzyme